jgi:hypothetical protein
MKSLQVSEGNCSTLTEKPELNLIIAIIWQALSCAFVNKACRMGFSAFYIRLSRLFQDLSIARADGSYPSIIKKLVKAKVLIIDDLRLTPMSST